MPEEHRHDPDSWDFTEVLGRPEFHLHEALRNLWPVFYYTMRIGDSILEVGAGSGKGAILAKRLSPHKRVVALDCAEQACQVERLYQRAAGTQLEAVIRADALHLPFQDQSFGIAYSIGMLEHYPDEWIRAAVSEQLRVAEAVLVSVPLDRYLMVFKGNHGDERPMDKVTWLHLLSQVGDIVELAFTGPQTEEYWLQVILTGRR